MQFAIQHVFRARECAFAGCGGVHAVYRHGLRAVFIVDACYYIRHADTFLQQRSSLTSAFESAAGLIPKFLSTAISAHRVRELCELPKERHGKTALPQGALMVELKM